MTIAVDLGRKATKQTNKSTCSEIIHLLKLVDYVNEQVDRGTRYMYNYNLFSDSKRTVISYVLTEMCLH